MPSIEKTPSLAPRTQSILMRLSESSRKLRESENATKLLKYENEYARLKKQYEDSKANTLTYKRKLLETFQSFARTLNQPAKRYRDSDFEIRSLSDECERLIDEMTNIIAETSSHETNQEANLLKHQIHELELKLNQAKPDESSVEQSLREEKAVLKQKIILLSQSQSDFLSDAESDRMRELRMRSFEISSELNTVKQKIATIRKSPKAPAIDKLKNFLLMQQQELNDRTRSVDLLQASVGSLTSELTLLQSKNRALQAEIDMLRIRIQPSK